MPDFRLKIVTPERVVYDDAVLAVTLPTQDGEITVLPGHVPLVSMLKAGHLVIQQTKGVDDFSVSGGFIKIDAGQVTVLADTSEHAEAIDLQRAEEAHARAQQTLADLKHHENVDYAAISAQLEKELARIKVATRRKARHPR